MSIVRRAINKAIGLASAFVPDKHKQSLLETAYLSHERTSLQNLLFDGVFSHWVLNTYLKERDPDRRETLKERIVTGRGGMFIADGYWNEPFDRTRIMGDIPIDRGWSFDLRPANDFQSQDARTFP